MTTPVRPDQDNKIRTRLIHLKNNTEILDDGIVTAYKMRTNDQVVF